ncbi:MAG: hypothetical protein AB7N91_16490 [Candidatus Tectimicrobiota bacterium]
MSGITPALLSASGREHTLRSHDGISRSRLLQAQAETHTSADFTFLTAEGDKVTLSADSLQQASYTRYDARGTLHGQRLKARAEELTLSATQNTAFSVEGELSAEELQDIQEVVEQVSALAQDVFAGGDTDDLTQALDLDDLSTLQSFEATLEYSQSLSLSRITQGSGHGRRAASAAPLVLAEAPPASAPSSSPSQLLEALREAEAATPAAATPAGQASSPERPQQATIGAFGSHQQLFTAVREAIQRVGSQQANGEVRHQRADGSSDSVQPGQHRRPSAFRALAENLSARAAAGGASPQQPLSRLASQFLQRLQVLGRPATTPASETPAVPQENAPQPTASEAPSPLAA